MLKREVKLSSLGMKKIVRPTAHKQLFSFRRALPLELERNFFQFTLSESKEDRKKKLTKLITSLNVSPLSSYISDVSIREIKIQK